nr:unnamed protein product [Digitaria exilis]
MQSVTKVVIGLQRPGSNGLRSREVVPSSGRRSVATPCARHAAKAAVIRSESSSGRGQHCAPAKAVADAAPIQATKKRVFNFGKGKSEGNKTMKELVSIAISYMLAVSCPHAWIGSDGSLLVRLGGKGANLAEMSSIGLSVPPGFTVSTEACKQYQEAGYNLPQGLWDEVLEGLQWVEEYMGARLGDPQRPLLLSVRSGAAVSMPGMMDTVLNLGLNDEVAAGLAAKSGERFAYDSYRRFLDMFGNVYSRSRLTLRASRRPARHAGDPKKQLELAVLAVFNSWDSPRAKKYRSINQISGLVGTAVNVQSMVFGNMGETSGTGVLFTRNPSTGENKLYGEFLVNAQGEDVVAGIRTPEDLDKMKEVMPEAYQELVENCSILESHYKEMMENRLWMLQCRSGKRTGQGAVKIAVDMVNEGLVDRHQAIKMVEPGHLDQLLHPQFENPKAYKDQVIATGLPASPGAAVGQIVFTAEDAEAWNAQGKPAILVRTETSPEDVGGMHAAAGILTARGGMTSHAAVVARGWGKCCVSGCSSVLVNDAEKSVVIGDKVLHEGDWLSLNGSTGEVILGKQPLSPPALSGDLGTFMSWVDEVRKLKVLANADTPEDALTARNNGAQGIGLCRTEHMFFASDERIKAVRQMIMAPTLELRQKALDRLLPYQRSDFEGIFRAMDGLPVTIRLLDPPLHEFLPEGNVEDIELGHQVAVIREIASKVFTDTGKTVGYKIGTMIEIPRAALVADEIAEQAEFFSFGTNDLTQMTFGYSRDDVGKFLPIYLGQGILQHDPFEVLDQRGVGELVKFATERGRKARPNLKVGICGEHGGEPSSVAFFAKSGLDYVSCSPFRVPIARLAAAQVLV